MSAAPAKKVAAKVKKPRAAKQLTATASEMLMHDLLRDVPVMNDVVTRLEDEAKKAKGGQHKDKQELLAENAETWAAFVADIKKRGIVESLTVVAIPKDHAHAKNGNKWWIVDGRHRFKAGLEAGIKAFPIKITTEDPATYILGALCSRNHFNKQQRAFFALTLHPELVADQSGKRSDLVDQPPESFGRFESRAKLAEAIGVSDDTINIAAKVHTLFSKSPAAKKKYLSLIFAGVSLQGILRGDGADNSPHGGGDNRDAVWQRLKAKWQREGTALAKDWAEVEQAGEEAKAEALEAFTTYLQALPPALLEHAQHILNEDAD